MKNKKSKLLIEKSLSQETLGDLEKKYGVKFEAPANTKVWRYLEGNGLPTLARIIRNFG